MTKSLQDSVTTATSRFILRPRLVHQLHQRFHVRVVLVRGGAGFGKTVALRQAMSENKIIGHGRDVWIPVRDCGAREEFVWSHIGRELGLGSEPSPETMFEAILGAAPKPVCLCFDDLHLLDDVSRIDGLIDYLPANAHFCITTRTNVALSLARLIAAGEVTSIGAEDLTFDDDELSEYASVTGASLNQLQGSAGWPAHAALLAHNGAEVANRFVAEEVLNGRSQDDLRDLAAWASIGRSDLTLLAELFSGSDPIQLAESLPMIDEDEQGIKLHDLWLDPLSSVLTDIERRAVQARAASLIVTADPERATGLWCQANAWPELMMYFRDCTLGLRDPPGLAHLRATVDALPQGFRHEPATLMAAALVSLDDDPSAAYEMFQTASEKFRELQDVHGEVAALLNLGDMAQAKGLADDLERVWQRVHELSVAGDPWVADIRDILQVMIHRTERDSQAGLNLLDTIEQRSSDASVAAIVPWLRASLSLQIGKPRDAIAAAREALDATSATIRALALASLGWALWLDGRRADTIALLEDSMAIVRERADPSWVHTAATYFGFALLMIGRTEDGRALVEHAREIHDRSFGNDGAQAVVDALLALCDGDEPAAIAFLAAIEDQDVQAGDMMRRACALWFVLRPSVRPRLRELSGCFTVAVELGHALVSARAGDLVPVRRLHLPPSEIVGAHLPPPWVVELALALSAADRADVAVELIDALGPPVRRAMLAAQEVSPSPAGALLVGSLRPEPRCAWRLCVLGEPLLLKDGESFDDPLWRRGRVRELLMWLVENPDSSRSQAAAALWPDFDEKKSKRNLEVTLSYLVALLDGDRSADEPPYFVTRDADKLVLERAVGLSIDVDDFVSHLRKAANYEGQASPSAALTHYLAAVDLYRGSYLTLRVEPEWAEGPRRRVAIEFVEAASRACELLIASNEAETALEIAVRAVATDPWHERSRRALVCAHFQLRDYPGAAAATDTYLGVINEIGLETHPEIVAITRQIGLIATR